MDWLRHAFALDPAGPAAPTDEQRRIVERLCVEIVRRRLTTPAVVFLETARPLSSVAGQAIHFFAPLISLITRGGEHRQIALFLERRGSVDFLIARIEELERQAQAVEDRPPRANSDRPFSL